MKQIYCFSNSKLSFIEIRNFYRKFVFLILFFSILISFFIFGSFLVFNDYINPDSELQSLQKKNALLKGKINAIVNNYKKLDNDINSIADQTHDLRLKANLEPLEQQEELFGTGGNAFEPIKLSEAASLESFLQSTVTFADRVAEKTKLQSDNVEEIKNTLASNEKLYDDLPAVKPSDGNMGDGFKVRFHPILHIRQMHNGQDIVCDIGTKVYATGGGTVEFAGWRSGTGLTIEINHGFNYKTIYGHLSKSDVNEGQKVERGDLIALSGRSGSLCHGPHLHYEVRLNNIPLDPKNFMYDDVTVADLLKR